MRAELLAISNIDIEVDMESEKVQKIKRIIFWLDELKDIEKYKNYCDGYNLFYSKPRLKFVGKFLNVENEVKLSDWAKAMFSEWLDEQSEHIQRLIDESDSELVEIAKCILDGKMKL